MGGASKIAILHHCNPTNATNTGAIVALQYVHGFPDMVFELCKNVDALAQGFSGRIFVY